MDPLRRHIIIILLNVKGHSLDFWQVIKLSSCSLPELLYTLEKMKKEGLVTLENSRVSLVNPGLMLTELLSSFPPSLSSIIGNYSRYRAMVNFADEGLDQLPITKRSVAKKLSTILDRNDLYDKKIICIGDDDLFSIACALTRLPQRVDVIDASPEVIEFLTTVRKTLPVAMDAYKHNLLVPLPSSLKNRYDVVITAPPDTVDGIIFFISKGIELLKKRGVIYFSMSEVLLDRNMWREIQYILLEHNMVLTDIIKDCEEYKATGNEFLWRGADKLPSWITKPARKPWFIASLFRAEITGKKKKISHKKIRPEELITKLL